MTYPITVEKVSLDHKQGTKSYHLTMIQTSTGQGAVIKRYGKTGAFGTIKTETYATAAETQKAWESAHAQRRSRGYSVVKDQTHTCDTSSELVIAVGRTVWPKLGGDFAKHIDPALDTTGMRAPDAPDRDEDGNYTGKAPPRMPFTQEQIEEAERQKREAQKDAVRSHPLFGAF